MILFRSNKFDFIHQRVPIQPPERRVRVSIQWTKDATQAKLYHFSVKPTQISESVETQPPKNPHGPIPSCFSSSFPHHDYSSLLQDYASRSSRGTRPAHMPCTSLSFSSPYRLPILQTWRKNHCSSPTPPCCRSSQFSSSKGCQPRCTQFGAEAYVVDAVVGGSGHEYYFDLYRSIGRLIWEDLRRANFCLPEGRERGGRRDIATQEVVSA